MSFTPTKHPKTKPTPNTVYGPERSSAAGFGAASTPTAMHTQSTIPGYCTTGLAQATTQRQGHNTVRLTFVARHNAWKRAAMRSAYSCAACFTVFFAPRRSRVMRRAIDMRFIEWPLMGAASLQVCDISTSWLVSSCFRIPSTTSFTRGMSFEVHVWFLGMNCAGVHQCPPVGV